MAERAYALYSSWGYTTRSRTAATASPTSPSTTSRPGCLTVRLDRHRRAGTARAAGTRSSLPVAPAGADADPSQCRDSARATTSSRTRSFTSSRTRCFRPTRTSGCTKGSPNGQRFAPTSAIGGLEQNPDRTMDCVGSECGDTEFDRNGYPGWMLFEYLAERFGDSAVKSVLDTSAATPALSGTQALSRVVQPLGTTLGKFFEDYTTARLTGNFTSELLAGVLPQTQGSIVVGLDERRTLPGDARSQPPRRSLSSTSRTASTPTPGPATRRRSLSRSRCRAGVATTPYYYAEHEGRDRPGVHGLGQHRHVDGPVEHLRSQPARIRLATERDERRASRLHSTDASSRSPERSRSTSRSPQARASRPQA